MEEEVECPKCLGVGVNFNGIRMIRCKLCKGKHVVKDVVAEAFIHEHILDDV